VLDVDGMVVQSIRMFWQEICGFLNNHLWILKRIGIHGLSYGGLNCLQALSRNSDVFVAGVANAPVFNWISQGRFDGAILYDYNPRMFGTALPVGPEPDMAVPQWIQRVNKNVDLAYLSSPISRLENFTSPVLIIHGDSDRNVAFQESLGLVRALKRNGKGIVRTLVFPNERHALALWKNDVIAAQATFDFLKETV